MNKLNRQLESIIEKSINDHFINLHLDCWVQISTSKISLLVDIEYCTNKDVWEEFLIFIELIFKTNNKHYEILNSSFNNKYVEVYNYDISYFEKQIVFA